MVSQVINDSDGDKHHPSRNERSQDDASCCLSENYEPKSPGARGVAFQDESLGNNKSTLGAS